MRPAEKGFLLLCSHLGNPDRKPLSVAQFRILAQRVQAMEKPSEIRDVELIDLQALGYSREMAVPDKRWISSDPSQAAGVGGTGMPLGQG